MNNKVQMIFCKKFSIFNKNFLFHVFSEKQFLFFLKNSDMICTRVVLDDARVSRKQKISVASSTEMLLTAKTDAPFMILFLSTRSQRELLSKTLLVSRCHVNSRENS